MCSHLSCWCFFRSSLKFKISVLDDNVLRAPYFTFHLQGITVLVRYLVCFLVLSCQPVWHCSGPGLSMMLMQKACREAGTARSAAVAFGGPMALEYIPIYAVLVCTGLT